jgi:hypothetical protein
MFGNDVFEHGATPNQVLRDDSFEHGRIARPIPDALWIDHGNWASFTDPEAIGFRAQDAALFGQTELLQASFEKLPGFERPVPIATLGLCLIAAEKNVSRRHRDPDFRSHALQTIARLVTTCFCFGLGVLIHRGIA